MRVLVVEDDAGIAEGLRSGLRRHGCVVDTVGTLGAAQAALAAEAFDIVLLDLGLPDGDGLTLLRRLREARAGRGTDAKAPVLIMTARDEVASRISGLDLGADDYLPKPFDIDELAARMRALRRRAVGRAQPTLRFGAIEIDPSARTVQRDGGLGRSDRARVRRAARAGRREPARAVAVADRVGAVRPRRQHARQQCRRGPRAPAAAQAGRGPDPHDARRGLLHSAAPPP